jgi:hypothetical protein
MTLDEAKNMPLFCVKMIMVLERIANALEKLVNLDSQQ